MVDSRTEFWIDFITRHHVRQMVEVGVWRGTFAEAVLRNCPCVERYYLVDPWRHLPAWNKPFNVDQSDFERVFDEAMRRTAFAEDRRMVLRGTITEVIDRIPDASLDLAYIDGDHTLRGISIDLLCCYRKVKPAGYLGGDDFTPSIWQHSSEFEPSMVFPYAVYFAEAVHLPITACSENQFLIEKNGSAFAFHDPLRRYCDRTLQAQIQARPSRIKSALRSIKQTFTGQA